MEAELIAQLFQKQQQMISHVMSMMKKIQSTQEKLMISVGRARKRARSLEASPVCSQTDEESQQWQHTEGALVPERIKRLKRTYQILPNIGETVEIVLREVGGRVFQQGRVVGIGRNDGSLLMTSTVDGFDSDYSRPVDLVYPCRDGVQGDVFDPHERVECRWAQQGVPDQWWPAVIVGRTARGWHVRFDDLMEGYPDVIEVATEDVRPVSPAFGSVCWEELLENYWNVPVRRARATLMCAKRSECPLSALPPDVISYMLTQYVVPAPPKFLYFLDKLQHQ